MVSLSLEETIEIVKQCVGEVNCPVEAGRANGCYLYGFHNCKDLLRDKVLALLKEQQDEIYALRVELASSNELAEGYAELLKEREAVKVQYTAMGGLRYGACPQCDARIDNLVNPKACGFCGKELKWE